MLTLHLHPLLHARGIEKPFSWLRQNGFTHSMAYNLLDQPIVLNLGYMEKLCHLLHCTPNDLLLFTPSDDLPLTDAHPLRQLAKKEERASVSQQIRNLPLQQLDQVLELIHQLQGGTDDTKEST